MTDRISEYLTRVTGAYQADDGRRYRTREQVLEAVKECGSLPPRSLLVGWQPIATADKDQERLTLGIFRSGKLEEIHVGGYRHAYNDDDASCWWSDQCDDEIAPTHWMPDLGGTPAPHVVGSETRYHLEWISAPRPPVHPNPMTGRQSFVSFDKAVAHMKAQAPDARFVSLEERTTTSIDRSKAFRAALSAPEAEG